MKRRKRTTTWSSVSLGADDGAPPTPTALAILHKLAQTTAAILESPMAVSYTVEAFPVILLCARCLCHQRITIISYKGKGPYNPYKFYCRTTESYKPSLPIPKGRRGGTNVRNSMIVTSTNFLRDIWSVHKMDRKSNPDACWPNSCDEEHMPCNQVYILTKKRQAPMYDQRPQCSPPKTTKINGEKNGD